MAKGSVRKKGKKWYYRFYVEDASGNRIQKEMPGTESNSETEALLRKAMDEYENQAFVAKASNMMNAPPHFVPCGKRCKCYHGYCAGSLVCQMLSMYRSAKVRAMPTAEASLAYRHRRI